MNNTFNIKRFGWVLGKDFQENGRRYLLQFLTMFGIMLVILTMVSWSNYNTFDYDPARFSADDLNQTLLNIVLFMFFAFGILIASTLMEPMRNKTGRIAYLTNPSSNFEKILSRWLIVTVVYIIAFFVALWLADVFRVGICAAKYAEFDVRFLDFNMLVDSGNSERNYYVVDDQPSFRLGLGFYIFIQSLFILGSTFWEKATFVKTFSASIVIFMLFLLICSWTIKIAYSDFENFTNVLNSFQVHKFGDDKAFLLAACGFIFFALVNWTIAFFRFRESEIIKRL